MLASALPPAESFSFKDLAGPRYIRMGPGPLPAPSLLYRSSSGFFSTFSLVFLPSQPSCCLARPIQPRRLVSSTAARLRVAPPLLLHPAAHASFFAKIGLCRDSPPLFLFPAPLSYIFYLVKICCTFFLIHVYLFILSFFLLHPLDARAALYIMCTAPLHPSVNALPHRANNRSSCISRLRTASGAAQ